MADDTPAANDITKLLQAWAGGDKGALDDLIPQVYAELHRLARATLRREGTNKKLQTTEVVNEAYDAPICQDSRSRSQVCGLARSVVCHHALKDLAGEKAFETADDLPFGPPFSGASFDVVEGW